MGKGNVRTPLSHTAKAVRAAVVAVAFISLLLIGYRMARACLWPAPIDDGHVLPVYQDGGVSGLSITQLGAVGRESPEQLTVEWTNRDLEQVVLDEAFTVYRLTEGAWQALEPAGDAARVDRRHTLRRGERVRITYQIRAHYGAAGPGAYRVEAAFQYVVDPAGTSQEQTAFVDFLVPGEEGTTRLYADYAFGEDIASMAICSFRPFYTEMPFFHIGTDAFCCSSDPFQQRPVYDICVPQPQYREVPFDPARLEDEMCLWVIDRRAFLAKYKSYKQIDIYSKDERTAYSLLYADEDVYVLNGSRDQLWYMIRLNPLRGADRAQGG